MTITVHTTEGHSFLGLVGYLTESEDRVAWTETKQLITGDPMTAARVMAATACNQTALKQAAGIKMSGRKAGGAVMHLSISWKDEEAEHRNLTPEAMSKAVDVALQNIGATKKQRAQYANEHQAVIVAHNDKKHSHLHLVINRVHPEHGVMLPTGNDFLKLSSVALRYEQEGGRIYCKQRAINWKLRSKRSVRGQRTTRKVWNLRRSQAPGLAALIEGENKQRDRTIYLRKRSLQKAHRQEWQELDQAYKRRLEQLGERAIATQQKAIADFKRRWVGQWQDRYDKKEATFAALLGNEATFRGKLSNLKEAAPDLRHGGIKSLMQAIHQLCQLATSPNERLTALAKLEAAKDKALARAEAKDLTKLKDVLLKARQQWQTKARDEYFQYRSKLIKYQQEERTAFRNEWQQRNRAREASYEHSVLPSRMEAALSFNQAQEATQQRTQARRYGR